LGVVHLPQRIYHLVPPRFWDRAGTEPYRAESLSSEGFIHCSYEAQVARSANRFYARHDELLVLTIDPDLLASPVREEAATGGETFPHIYGPLDRRAVVAVQSLRRDAQGHWAFP
jgi:uncharacterized protein (DUF952 family)